MVRLGLSLGLVSAVSFLIDENLIDECLLDEFT